ncbi:hypothetical protein SISSUDRAFT_1033788 [Sistotremastrum suecicum HHB10207 ss-3]|uniref:Uncharacterized protein n=1 Tax=Sistotremastrum suecicum HHB10207 ss-3 TaxID=1314776 RepID=A0A166CVX3_9AGAM|nr:hypothetical protein SISSUDRAFT_1033788 [Sistotremastrum suecicum HHB10207 ss-3]
MPSDEYTTHHIAIERHASWCFGRVKLTVKSGWGSWSKKLQEVEALSHRIRCPANHRYAPGPPGWIKIPFPGRATLEVNSVMSSASVRRGFRFLMSSFSKNRAKESSLSRRHRSKRHRFAERAENRERHILMRGAYQEIGAKDRSADANISSQKPKSRAAQTKLTKCRPSVAALVRLSKTETFTETCILEFKDCVETVRPVRAIFEQKDPAGQQEFGTDLNA